MTDAGSRAECPRNTNRLQKLCHCISRLAFRNCGSGFYFPGETDVFYLIWGVLCCIGSFVKYFHRDLLFHSLVTYGLSNCEIDWSLFSALIQSFVVDCAQSTNWLLLSIKDFPKHALCFSHSFARLFIRSLSHSFIQPYMQSPIHIHPSTKKTYSARETVK